MPEPIVVEEPKPTEAAAAVVTTQEEVPKFEVGEGDRAALRQVHTSARELERLQGAIGDREKELAELDEKVAAKQTGTKPTIEADDEGMVEAYGGRIPKALADHLDSLSKTAPGIEALREEVRSLRNADVEAERAEHNEAIEKSLQTLVYAARAQLIPGLSDKATTRTNKTCWSEFEDQWNGFIENRPADAGPVTDEEITSLASKAVLSVREDMTELGWKQVAANRVAAAGQPPGPAGTPAETGAKEYKDMTAAEKRKAETEANLTGGHVTFGP